jgi:hypothetical protein
MLGVALALRCNGDSIPMFGDICAGTPRLPPDVPDAAAATLGEATTFAVAALLFGDFGAPDGGPNTAWQDLGFNLDGHATGPGSNNVCGRAPGAPSSIQTDGRLSGCPGIDNSFGANVIPIFEGADSDPRPSMTLTNLIQQGAFTLQLQIRGLDLSSAQSATGLIAQSFASNRFDATAAPTFSPTEDWPVRDDLHPDPAVGASFAVAYVNRGTFVAREGNVVLSVVQGPGRRIDLHIHHAIVAMDLKGDHAINGTLAGVLQVSEFIADARPFAIAISKSLCGDAFDGVAQQFKQCVDILDDGTNAAGKPCNAISLGIGFTAKRIANPKRTAPPEPQTDNCSADAGVDAPTD